MRRASETPVKKGEEDIDEFPAERTVVTNRPPAGVNAPAQAFQPTPQPMQEPEQPREDPRVIPIASNDKLNALRSLSLDGDSKLAPHEVTHPVVRRGHSEQAPRRGGTLPWVLLLLLGSGVGVREFLRWRESHAPGQKQAANGQPSAIRTQVVQPTGSTSQSLQAAGYIAARTPITVGTPIGGQIKKVNVEAGQTVKLNELIAQLNDGQVRAEMSLAHARASAAERVLKRIRKLYEAQAATPADLDRAQGELEVARAQTIPLSQKIQQSKILSPVDGTILEVLAHPGEILVGNAGVVKMADLRDMVAEVDVNESDLPSIQRRQSVDLTSEAYPDRTYSGAVSEIAATADRARGTVQVKVDLKVPDGSLRPGMSVKATFKPHGEEAPRILIPKSALVGNAVWVVGPGDLAQKRAVTAHPAGPSLVEVADGLKAGDRIVVDCTSITEGMKVQ